MNKRKCFFRQCIVNWWDSSPQERMEAESSAGVNEGPDTFMEDPSINKVGDGSSGPVMVDAREGIDQGRDHWFSALPL